MCPSNNKLPQRQTRIEAGAVMLRCPQGLVVLSVLLCLLRPSVCKPCQVTGLCPVNRDPSLPSDSQQSCICTVCDTSQSHDEASDGAHEARALQTSRWPSTVHSLHFNALLAITGTLALRLRCRAGSKGKPLPSYQTSRWPCARAQRQWPGCPRRHSHTFPSYPWMANLAPTAPCLASMRWGTSACGCGPPRTEPLLCRHLHTSVSSQRTPT